MRLLSSKQTHTFPAILPSLPETTMQITDHSTEQALLGVQHRLRNPPTSSASSCFIFSHAASAQANLSVATELSMSLSSSPQAVRFPPPAPPMAQLELLPLYPSPSMVRSQQQQQHQQPSLMQASMGLYHSLMQAGIGSVNPPSVQGCVAAPSSLGLTCKRGDMGAGFPIHRTSTQTSRAGLDIDVNQVPSSSDSEEDGEDDGANPSLQLSDSMNNAGLQRGGSFSAIEDSPVSLKRDREKMGSENNNSNNNMYEVSSRASDEEEGACTRKKLRLSKDQSALLEESFKEHSTLNPKQKNALAKQLNLRPRQVEVWFQNRRARTKLKQTEVDCELLKRCCETLTEENRRLQKEVQELRALKVGAPCVIAQDFYMPLPAATLTMCPSCERLATLDTPGTRTGKQHRAPAAPSAPAAPLGLNHPHRPQPSAAC